MAMKASGGVFCLVGALSLLVDCAGAGGKVAGVPDSDGGVGGLHRVVGLTNPRAIAVGVSNSLAIDADGGLWGWGYGGGSPYGSTALPTPRGVGSVVAIADSATHWLALTEGRVYERAMFYPGSQGAGGGVEGRWGFESSDESGGFVAGLDEVTAVAAGVPQAVALRRDGTVWAWGEYDFSWLNLVPIPPRQPLRQVPGISGAVGVGAEGAVSWALLSDGGVVQWTADDSPYLDAGADSGWPWPVMGLPPIRAIETSSAVAISVSGGVWLFGRSPGAVPVEVSGLNDIVQVSARYAVNSAGAAFSITRPDGGPPKGSIITGLPPVRAIAASTDPNGHALATGLDGTIYSWGANYKGQLGDGTVTP